MLKDVMKNVAVFVDGRSYVGEASQVTLPELSINTEEFRAGGMDAPVEVDMGMAALRCGVQWVTVPVDAMKLLGRRDIPLTLRGALVSHDGTTRGATAELRGKFITQAPGDWAGGSQATFAAQFTADYYKLTVGGEEIYEVDVPRMVRRIGGVDQLADMRSALGM